MAFILFLKGILIGFGLAVPIGPIGILCLRKTITKGRLQGMIIGLGGATADLFYSAIAAFGITAISTTIDKHRFEIRLAGGIFLLCLGLFTYFTQPKERKVQNSHSEIVWSYLFTIFLTMTNPLTIFAFIVVFATIEIGHLINSFYILSLVLGVFAGSCSWFALLTFFGNYFGEKFNQYLLPRVNKVAGILIIISGLVSIISVL